VSLLLPAGAKLSGKKRLPPEKRTYGFRQKHRHAPYSVQLCVNCLAAIAGIYQQEFNPHASSSMTVIRRAVSVRHQHIRTVLFSKAATY